MPQRPNPCPLETTLVTLMLKLKEAPTWSKPQLIKNVLPERPKPNPRQMPNSTAIILVPTLPHMLDLDIPTLKLPILDTPTLTLPTPGFPMLKRLLKDIPTFLA